MRVLRSPGAPLWRVWMALGLVAAVIVVLFYITTKIWIRSGPGLIIPVQRVEVPSRTYRKSSYFCRRMPDWLEICQYELVCTDGKQLVLIDDTKTEKEEFRFKAPQLETPNWEPRPAPPPRPDKGNPIPYESKGLGYYIPASQVRWPGEKEGAAEVQYSIQWLNGSMWLVSPESYDTWNPWHFLIAVFPMWNLQYLNATISGGRNNDGLNDYPYTRWTGSKPFPSIDNVIMWDMVYNKIHHNLAMLGLILPNHTTIYWEEDILFDGKYLADPNQSPPSPDARNRNKPAQPLNLSATSLVCANTGFMAGYKYGIFTGPAEAFSFREKVYRLYNLPFTQPPYFVLIVDRGDRGRAFLNPKEIVRIVSDVLHLPYKYLYDPEMLSVEDNVRTFYGAGLSIHPHGAGISNIMFQQPKSAVIEIFPYIHHQAAFSQLAMHCRVLYFPIYTYAKGSTVDYSSPELEARCKDATVFQLATDLQCLHPLLGSLVSPASYILELTIVNAMRAIGYPVEPSTALHAWIKSNTNLNRTEV